MSDQAPVAMKVGWYPPSPAIAALFGAYISQLRAERLLSIEVLIHDSDLTLDWWRAVEQGDLELTREMVTNIQVLFNQSPPTPAPGPRALHAQRTRRRKVELLSVLAELNQYPYGPRALELRRVLHTVNGTGAEDVASEPDAPSSFAEAVSGTAKTLVFAPVVWFFAVLLLAARVLELNLVATSGSGSAPGWANELHRVTAYLVWPAALLGVLAAMFAVHLGNSVLERAASLGRSPNRASDLELIRTWFAVQGVTWTTKAGLAIGPTLAWLVPRHRAAALRTGQRAQAAERLEFTMALACIPCSTAAIVAAVVGGRNVADLGPVAVLLLSLGLT